jgi:MFS family permease
MAGRDRQSWLIAACLFVSLFLLWGSAYNTTGLFIAPLLKQFGWGRTQVSLLFAVLALASGVSAPLAGRLLERIEARTVIVGGAVLSGLGLVAASRANSFPPMLLAYAMLGLGLGFATFVPTALVVSNWFGERRGLALGIVMTGQSIGGMVMEPVISHIIANAGWRIGELVLAVPMFAIVTPLVFAFVRSHPPENPVAAEESQSSGQDIGGVSGLTVAQALRTRSFWMIVLAEFFYPLAAAGAFVHLVAYLSGIGYSETNAALSFSFLLLCTTIGQPVIGMVADRIGGRLALALSFCVLAISLVILVAASKTAILALFVLVFGFIAAGPMVALPLVVAESLGLKHYGSLMGLVGFPFTLGLALGPLVAGVIYDLTASYSRAFELSAVIALAGVVAALICVPSEWERTSMAADSGVGRSKAAGF